MKKIVIASAALFLSLTMHAQHFVLGGKAGLNYSESVITSVAGPGGITADDVEGYTGTGIVFGGFLRLYAGKLIIQPELLFSENNQSVKLNDLSWDDVTISGVNRMDIPVLFGCKFMKVFRLSAGPVFVSRKTLPSDKLLDFEHVKTDYQIGLGFDVNRIAFDARFQGVTHAQEDDIMSDAGLVKIDSRKNMFQFTMGYKLFK